MINVQELLGKVANNGTTLAGILAYGEWNTLVQAVRELQGLVASDERLNNINTQLTALSDRITALKTEKDGEIAQVLQQINQTLQAILTEQGARQQGDAALQTAIDNMSDAFSDTIDAIRDIVDSKATIVELSSYMTNNAQLPKRGLYVWYGNPVDSRMFTKSDGDTLWLVFCLRKGDDTDSNFGAGIRDCLVYSTNGDSDPFYYVGRYLNANIPADVQKAFGYDDKAKIVTINLSDYYPSLEESQNGYIALDEEELADIFETPSKAYALHDRRLRVITDELEYYGYPATMQYSGENFHRLTVDMGTEILIISIPDEGASALAFSSNGAMRLISLTEIPVGTVTEDNFDAGVKTKLNKRDVIDVEWWFDPAPRRLYTPTKAGLYWYVPTEKQLLVSVETENSGVYEFVEVTPQGNTIYIDVDENIPYIWKDDEMSSIAPKKAPASIFNATNEVPISGYYVLCDAENESTSAVHAAWNAEKAVSGLIISFEIGAGIWKTYQYVGRTVTEVNWLNPDNWKDFGSLAAGSEPYIIINNTCGAPIAGDYYTLETAVARLVAYQQETSVIYAKKGLIISYQTGENVMETKQFQGEIADFGEVGLWKDFGGGGSQVETSDDPEEDGENAFSTGGAYNHIPANLEVDTETAGVVKIKMVNAAGEDIGDEQQFNVGTGGGGGGGGTVVAMAFQNSPLYGSAGGSFLLRAAIRSVTTVGSTEQYNTIATVDIYDRDTNTLLKSLNVNQASSADLQTYDFLFDLSEYFKAAGVRRLRLVATDDAANTGSRNVNVTAVDVTITSAQTLQYTQSTALVAGGSTKNVTLYKFANNASDRGINAITEIFLNGSWQVLGQAVITDTYTHGVSINPSNCLGQTLTHGAYPLRIHGVDVASGVVGNYLYTGIFVINENSSVPLVVESWVSETVNPTVKLYETIVVNYAVYDPNSTSPTAQVYLDGSQVQSHTAYRSNVYTFRHQVTGVASDGTVSEIVKVKCGNTFGAEATFLVSGSVIDAVIKAGAIYAFDFSNRSNEESDHSIVSGGYEIAVSGSNWSTNGFGTFNGERALCIKEDVTAVLNHRPFSVTSIENNGFGIQFAFAAKNLTDDNAVLMSCFDEGHGAGFYVTGKAVGIYCATGQVNHKEERAYKQGEKVTVAIVVEPVAEGLGQTRSGVTYYFMKLYLNGEEVAAIAYVPGQSNLIQNQEISFFGTEGDFYLFYNLAWEDYFLFDQAFQNYLVKLTDTETMATEYAQENVMASQAVTEQGVITTKLRPQAAALAERGMPYFIEAPYNGSNIEALDNTTSTKEQMYVTLYYIDPTRPWTNFVAYDVARRNQGTTSAKRPVKNPRYYLAQKKGSTYDKSTKTGGTRIVLLYTREQIVAMGYDGELWDKAAALAAINKIQIHENSIPVDIITVKVDYSDSSNANDCGVCDQMNATYRALGSLYMTPAQRAYDGTWKKGSLQLDGLVMNHSTANFPIAMYRSKSESGSDPYFHAKGNWKEDKKEQTALGFIDTPGYNKGCLNYGDFIEFYGLENESFADQTSRFLGTTGLDTDAVYVLSQYCGPKYKVMRHNGTSWVAQSGSMVQNANGKWSVTGDVVNPVDGFELLNYQGMDWFKGVSSLSDMMAPSTSFSKWVQALIDDGDISVETVPAWTYYFESLVDDDNLAIAYALGKKVPYNLYRWMLFCDTCDYDQYGSTALTRWRQGMYRFASPHSVMAYDVFTDYDAAVDQRAKNMQPMWFLEDGCSITTVDGVLTMKNANNETYENANGMMPMRMYLNKVYDCDTCNGKDNDGGQTVDPEVDPNKMPDANFTNPYAGYNSTLFRNIYLQQEVYIDANNTVLSLKTVASAMRSCTATVDGITLHPFSPEGATHFFINRRIKRWQKKVSSYDGERKYIDFTATADTMYFYALQGLGLTSLPAFIERRWRIRDGFYGTGDFFSGVLSGRIGAASGAGITIKAAKTGYFGVGNDSSGSLSESVFLEAGESHTFTQFLKEPGSLLYIYQADRMSKIDLSQISLDANFDFSVMTLAEEIYIGSNSHTEYGVGGYTELTNVRLGELPFLRILDIRNTRVTNIDCSSCPRLQSLYAAGSQLTRADIADGARITYMQLPATYNYLKLRYLPNLEMSGLVLANAASIQTLIVENCTKIDAMTLLRTIAGTSGSALRVVRAAPINTTFDGTDLATFSALHMSGLDANLTAQAAPALVGTYMLTVYTDNDVLTGWQAEFADLTIHQSQYTMVEFDDTVNDPANITNLENNTTGGSYQPSGHISKIRERLIPVTGKLNVSTHQFEGVRMSETNYKKLANGDDFPYNDSMGSGNDAFMRMTHHWFKGIDDFKNQKKYIAWSSLDNEPLSTASNINREVLSDILLRENTSVIVSYAINGESTLETPGLLNSASGYNTYQLDVEGMKQVRWPGLNHQTIGAVFLDEDGVVISSYHMAVSHALFDFVEGDYIFIDVPAGAKNFVFTSKATNSSLEAIAVDSTEIEAIEPDWVEWDECLGGIYEASVDNLLQLRSLSGVSVRVGTGTSTTSNEWQYDTDGNPVGSAPLNAMNYTQKDFQNLARLRGEGYQLFDYEMSKQMAILFYSVTGTRDAQLLCGYGQSAGGTTGYKDDIGNTNSVRGVGNGNKVLGFESFMACTYEWMDMVAVNVQSYEMFMKNRCSGVSADPVNAVWHIYDPIRHTERTVQGITTSGYCVARVKHGRHCDIIASKMSSDNSQWAANYCDGQWYSGSTGRVVGRAYNNSNASGGVAYAYSDHASSVSFSSIGSRLAFRGKIVITG